MKVLMISGDPNILKEGSDAHARISLQQSKVDLLDVFVWPQVHSTPKIRRAALKNEYDVITSQDPFWRGLFAWRLSRLTHARLNIQVHADLHAQSFIKRVLARFILRRADTIRVVSESIAKQVRALGARATVHVLPVFVDVRRFTHITHEPHEGKNILWVGRFESEKDPMRAIEVLKEVRVAGIDATLTMLGDGSLAAKLKSAQKGLPVSFPGWGDPVPHFARADVLLSTSHAESWGAIFVEALAAGVPVVAPDVGVARAAGAVVTDLEKLADALIRVLRSGERATLNFTLPTVEEWTDRWYKTLV